MSEIVTFTGQVTATSGEQPLDDDSISQYLACVGERVRKARVAGGMSRRELSERTGISQRYLAQLEVGKGNISIVLLLRIAKALEFGIEWIVGPDDPWSSEHARTAFLLQAATKAQRVQILKILEQAQPNQNKAKRIALIGLRGAGKSTLGGQIAARFGMAFLELNDEIEQIGGMPVAEVLALYGQEGYRLLEHQAIERVAATHDTLVLAIAGGIASQPDTFNYLLDNYHTIWLRADPEEHMQRVRAQGDERPMAGNANAMRELRQILTGREEQYRRADACLDTSGAAVEQSLAELADLVKSRI